jgi:FkbM family methyltransferase
MSYSQYDEEKHILAAFPEDKTEGRFLDVGAWHPTDKSNTRALYDRGWSGVMIEPSPQPVRALIEGYGYDPRVTIVAAALAIEKGFAELQITDDLVSTSDLKNYLAWKDHAKYIGKLVVPTITWEEIGNRYGGFDFVNIDAEGISVDLFRRMVEIGHYPTVVCVEHDDRMMGLCAVACGHGYRMNFSNATNCIFARS